MIDNQDINSSAFPKLFTYLILQLIKFAQVIHTSVNLCKFKMVDKHRKKLVYYFAWLCVLAHFACCAGKCKLKLFVISYCTLAKKPRSLRCQ